ncbi:winged helix-turn-helix domain-containing protein [Methanosalsum zhilinae]|uniref:winged helix-turn-helix domain-containing protein n=1 Tax=Methanosalsum zhilinae TaxID=39669 RepID=UPI0006620688|nr:winged helix-turn-helix domain-containing protein [Methanosalsum zhilinae]
MKREGKLNINPTQDHEASLMALQNPTRRQILDMLARYPMGADDIREELKIDAMQTKFHLSMLESSLSIEKRTKDNIVLYISFLQEVKYMLKML